MINAVAFDLDNTLIDFMTFKRETAKAAAEAMCDAGLDARPAAVAREIFDIYDEYGIEYQKTFSTLLWDRHKIRDLNEFERIQQAGIAAYLKRKFEVLRPYDGVHDVLGKVARKLWERTSEEAAKNGWRAFSLPQIYIITDAPRNKAWQRLVITGLDKPFSAEQVVTYDDTKRHKPSAMPFKAFLKKTGYKPEEVLFVGDSLARDVAGAKAVGMKTAWAKYGAVRKEKGPKPDFVLKKFSDVLKCV